MPARQDTESFGFLLNDITRLIRAEFDRRIGEAGLGLTPGDGRMLAYVARSGPVRQNVLAERIGVEAMTLSGALDRLEARGLVLRQPDPADRRAKLVQPTEAGEAMLAQTQPISAAIREDAAAGIERAEWDRLMVLLKKARANLQAVREGVRKDAAA